MDAAQEGFVAELLRIQISGEDHEDLEGDLEL
jgi:hypothetical protein